MNPELAELRRLRTLKSFADCQKKKKDRLILFPKGKRDRLLDLERKLILLPREARRASRVEALRKLKQAHRQ